MQKIKTLVWLKESKWLEEYQEKIEVMKNTAVTSSNNDEPNTENALDILPYDIKGKYLNGGYGEIEIFEEDKTYFTVFRNRKLRIIHQEKDIFHAVRADSPGRMGMPALHFTICNNERGDILTIEFESELDPIQFVRQ